MKLLIVEDEPKTGQYLRQGLAEAGFAVELAQDGLSGEHLALTGDFDLLILDVMLPRRDGWQILASVRAAGLGVPVLFLTARDAVEDRVRGLEAGADDYIQKPQSPQDIQEVFARIRAQLRIADLRRELAERNRQLEAMQAKLDLDLKLARKVQFGLMPKPLQDPFPNFCTSAMSPYSGTAKLAGGQGWNLISANFNAPWIVRSHWEAYKAGADAAGRKADPATWRVARTVLVTETDQEAEDYVARPDNAIRAYYNYLFTQLTRAGAIKIFMMAPDTKPEEITLQKVLDSMVIVGSPRTVVDKLASFRDEVGPFGGLLCTFHEWDEKEMWKASLRRLVGEVVPALRRHTP